MKHPNLNGPRLTGLAILLSSTLAGCAGHDWLPRSADSFEVVSEPAGAEIWIMDRRWGTTPAEIPVKAVFPATYPAEKQALYGRVTFRQAGCDSLTLPVGPRAVGSRLVGKLHCPQAAPAATPVAAPAASAPAVIAEPVAVPATPRTDVAPAAVPPPTPAAVGAKERLLRLKELREEGLISEEEYQQLRRRVLDTL